MSKYFFLQKTNKRVPLSDAVGCPINIAGKNIINIGKPIERMWIYWLYGGVDEYGEVYIKIYLKSKYSWMTDDKSLDIIESFKSDHIPEIVTFYSTDLFDFDWVEFFHPKGYMLPIPFYESEMLYGGFKITKTREREIFDLFLSAKEGSEYKKVKGWFNKYKKDHYEVWSRKDIEALSISAAIQYGVPLDGYGYDVEIDKESECESAKLLYEVEKTEKNTLEESAIIVMDEKQKMNLLRNRYMFFQETDTAVKLLSINKEWEFVLHGKNYSISPCMEKMCAYLIFSGRGFPDISETLRANYKNITSIEIDAFVNHFKKTHPIIETKFDWTNIPLYATNKRPLVVPNSSPHLVLLTQEQEKELIDMINLDNKDIRESIESWFYTYIHRYGLVSTYKRGDSLDSKDLACEFCRQHGINIYDLCFMEPKKRKKTVDDKWYDPLLSVLIVCTLLLIYISIAGGLMILGGKLMDNDWFVTGGLLFLLGFTMVFGPPGVWLKKNGFI